MAVSIFAYGTLQQQKVQLATYGRLLSGAADVLQGYRLMPLKISDPRVIELSGKAVHTIARATRDPLDRIEGLVFEISEDELAATDAYEVDLYARIEAALESGRKAWVYVGPPAAR